jgi:hypothetical protein
MMSNWNRFKMVCKPWTLVAGLLCFWMPGIQAQTYGFGDIPLDPATYDSYQQVWPDQYTDALPASYDARSHGLVTSPKNQGSCGSCWAFASVGAFESHLLKQFGGSPSDLSEQQMVSCETTMSGCCGGSMTSLRYWETKGPIQESCGPYGEGGTSCPTQRTVPCSNMNSCAQLTHRVTGFYTVPNDPAQMKASIYNDAPSYWRYNVFTDFTTFWNTASSGAVYRNTGGSFEGGHAVLLIGWDDTKQAYLCKNSWGATGGPQGDGTFWIGYSGHANDLNFQMANFKLTGSSAKNMLCLDVEGFCNDVKIFYDLTADGKIYNINGYEYGCGHPERGLDGSARTSAGTVYLEYAIVNSISTPNPRIAQWNAQLLLGSLSGTGQYGIHYDGYHQGSASMSSVPCPDAESATEFDSGSLEADVFDW